MTDLHTHILPNMDDGSRSAEESLCLLAMERAQGVDTVCLTPHFYRWQEPVEGFLKRRAQALERLRPLLDEKSPALVLGAETAWYASLAQEPLVERLCLGGSRYLLVELPFARWEHRLLDQLYELTCVTGLTPVLAHVERYARNQDRRQLAELLSMGLPMQVNAQSLLQWPLRRQCLKRMERGTWYVASDCHNVDARPPKMQEALTYIAGKWGWARTAALTGWTMDTR